MEGAKGSITRSLSFKLTLIFCILGLLGAVVSSVWSYRTMLSEAEEFVDEELSQIAAVVINYDMLIPRSWEGPRHLHERVFARFQTPSGRSIIITRPKDFPWRLPGMRQDPPPLGPEPSRDEKIPSLEDLTSHQFDIVIAPLIGRARDNIYLPPGIEDGIYTVLISDRRVRVFVGTKIDGQRFVIARPVSAAQALSSRAFTTSMTQFLVLMAVYLPLVILLVHLMFRPLRKSAARLDERSLDDLGAVEIDKAVPSEVDVFIQAINRLLDRIKENIALKRRFIADAAHEMRTPLAALSLQAENLLEEDLSPEASLKLSKLKQGINREKELMTGLLDLARAQDENLHTVKANVKVRELFMSIIDELGSIADDKDLDFGIEGECQEELICAGPLLKAVLVNLASNALKYTPKGGRVDLRAIEDDDSISFMVEDTGPGIPEENLPHVFEPFYRVKGDAAQEEGSGLGLSIAKAQAQKLNATLTLENKRTVEGDIAGLKAVVTLTKNQVTNPVTKQDLG